jgi:hypothetical protein
MKKSFLLIIFIFTIFFGLLPFQNINQSEAAACTINNATWSPTGQQKDDWYVAGKTKASITFNTTNCIGQTLNLDIKEADTCLVANCDDSLTDAKLENKPIKIEEVTTKVDFSLGEESCEAGPGFDCHYFFRIEKGDILLWSSWNKPSGELLYECSGTCLDDNWKIDKIGYSGGKGPIGSDGNPASVDPTGNTVIDSDYKLLAPIGNLDVVDKTTGVGDYLNIVLMIAIGLCGALAVIMIVVRGVQYMGDESVFGKTEAKHHIMQAVLGLILALGAYAILNTINPNLVGGSLTFNSVDIVISADDTSTGSSTSLCISTTNPPNPDSAKGSTLTLNPTMTNEYLPAIKKLTSISTGKRLLMTAQTHTEGFYPGSKSYRTNNPGNIGNTDDGKTRTFKTLVEGIDAQSTKVVSGQGSYQIGGKSKCALGDETYDGSLYQYLRIYSTGARKSNTYVNSIIGYFAQNGKTITARTKMSEIYNMK